MFTAFTFTTGGDFEPVNVLARVHPVNAVNIVNEPAERMNGSSWLGEHAPEPVNAPEEAEQGYTHEEETRVLLAYAEMCKAGGPVTRRALRDHLQWNNKWFTRVIKPVCDKHGIAVRES